VHEILIEKLTEILIEVLIEILIEILTELLSEILTEVSTEILTELLTEVLISLHHYTTIPTENKKKGHTPTILQCPSGKKNRLRKEGFLHFHGTITSIGRCAVVAAGCHCRTNGKEVVKGEECAAVRPSE
jgi:hypothetical protein